MKIHGKNPVKCRYVICMSCYGKKLDEGGTNQRKGRSATRVDSRNREVISPKDIATKSSKRHILSDDGAKALKRGKEDDECTHEQVGSLISIQDTSYWNKKYIKTLHKNLPTKCYMCKGTFNS